jgi:hypothetical protein
MWGRRGSASPRGLPFLAVVYLSLLPTYSSSRPGQGHEPAEEHTRQAQKRSRASALLRFVSRWFLRPVPRRPVPPHMPCACTLRHVAGGDGDGGEARRLRLRLFPRTGHIPPNFGCGVPPDSTTNTATCPIEPIVWNFWLLLRFLLASRLVLQDQVEASVEALMEASEVLDSRGGRTRRGKIIAKSKGAWLTIFDPRSNQLRACSVTS